MTRVAYWTLFAGLAAGLAACDGEKIDDTATTDTDPEADADTDADSDTDTDADSDTDTDTDVGTYTITGTAIQLDPEMPPAPEGACVKALDTTQATEGTPPDEVASGTVGAGGAYTLTGVPIAELPPLILVDDCENTEAPRVFPTVTPIQPDAMANVTDGGTLADVRSVVIGVTMLDAIDASLAAAGSTADLSTDGMLVGFVWDDAQRPVPGATIQCDGCTVYYGDGDATDGLFTTGRTLDTETSGMALYVSPGAPRGDYTAVAEGLTFPTFPSGAVPGGALFMPWIGTPE